MKYQEKNKLQKEGNATRKIGALCSSALELPEKLVCNDLRKNVTNSQSAFVLNLHHTMNSNNIVDFDVEELCLEYQHLKSMLIFEKLSSLRKLFLSGNEFVALEGLEKCTLLEELVLEDNCINQVKQEICSQTLWKLELGRNKLTSCVELSVFIGLTQLSIEKNNIESLKGLGFLSSLMELYAAHNRLNNIREICNIHGLPKLMVLDLSGNQLCEASEYRGYTIFMLKKLKVLDGVVVGDKELAEAKERHMGRLTRNMLEEFMGTDVFDNITAFNLSGKSLRHCGEVFNAADLKKLQELDLGQNFLTSIHPLKSLKSLQKLILQSNNIGNGPLLEKTSSNVTASMESCIEAESGGLLSSSNVTASMESCIEAESGGLLSQKGPLTETLTMLHTRGPEQSLCLEKLEILHLDKNSISDIRSLNLQQSSPNLKLLSLKRNIISKIDGLSSLLFLKKLFLDHNCIKKIEPNSFDNLPSLEEIHLSDNTIKTAKFMEKLTSLRSLNLAGNYLMVDRLGGFQCIKELSSLISLQELTLSENPICRQPHYRSAVISILGQLVCLDGEDVTEEQVAEAERYVNRDEKTGELWTVEQEPMVDAQALLHGSKVALKVTPFNFEAMSECQSTPLHSQSSESWDFEQMRSSGLSRSRQDGERRPTLIFMRNFYRVKEK